MKTVVVDYELGYCSSCGAEYSGSEVRFIDGVRSCPECLGVDNRIYYFCPDCPRQHGAFGCEAEL